MVKNNRLFQYGFLILGCWFSCNSATQLTCNIEPTVRYPDTPRVTIITSVFNCDKFIEGFLEDIVQQTIFADSELLMIDANSPGNEQQVIREYMQQYPNITYIKLDKDPGLFGVWNIGILLARGQYVCNANSDDRLAHNCYELHARALDAHSSIDLVYSDFYTTQKPNETIKHTSARKHTSWPGFSPQNMKKCVPGMNPMWRKSMHAKHGYFNEDFLSAGDWEMWCRAVEGGSVFKKVNAITGLYYQNPVGLSSNPNKMRLISRERELIRRLYSYYFNWRRHNGDKVRRLSSQADRASGLKNRNKKKRQPKKDKKRRIKKRRR